MAQSIRTLVPFNVSGRDARKGFSYQDHVAVSLCIGFLTNPRLAEVWLETHDDILLFWEDSGIVTVEFIQVKAIDQISRWSIPTVCGNGKPQDSIIKKMMDQDRCNEPVIFRIVTSYDVNNDLAILKAPISSTERTASLNKETDLAKEIRKKLGDHKSPNGKTIEEFIKSCWWEKRADVVGDLISSNKISLELALKTFGKSLYHDQRDEIYQKILKYCQDASTGDLSLDSDCYKITRSSFIEWLSKCIDSLYAPSTGTQKLEEKLSKAKNVPADYILSAKELRWNYLRDRLSSDFVQPSDMNIVESIILGELHRMKIALDNNELDEEQFHKLCIDKLNDLRNTPPLQGKSIPDYMLSGYMYKLTNECLHRFRRVEA